MYGRLARPRDRGGVAAVDLRGPRRTWVHAGTPERRRRQRDGRHPPVRAVGDARAPRVARAREGARRGLSSRRGRRSSTPFSWHPETFVCSRRGHVLPAAAVAHLRPEDGGVGVDLPDGRRFARCLRCDSWREVEHPASPARETLPPLEEIAMPRRGQALRDAITLRAIAIERGVHVVLFGLLFVAALLFRLNIGPLRSQARAILSALQAAAGNSSQGGSQGFIVRELQHLLDLRSGTVTILMFTALAYFVVELIEAIGLWHERRWAEYLTVIATAGLLAVRDPRAHAAHHGSSGGSARRQRGDRRVARVAQAALRVAWRARRRGSRGLRIRGSCWPRPPSPTSPHDLRPRHRETP